MCNDAIIAIKNEFLMTLLQDEMIWAAVHIHFHFSLHPRPRKWTDYIRRILVNQEKKWAFWKHARHHRCSSGETPGARRDWRCSSGETPGARRDWRCSSGGTPGARRDWRCSSGGTPGARRDWRGFPSVPGRAERQPAVHRSAVTVTTSICVIQTSEDGYSGAKNTPDTTETISNHLHHPAATLQLQPKRLRYCESSEKMLAVWFQFYIKSKSMFRCRLLGDDEATRNESSSVCTILKNNYVPQ